MTIIHFETNHPAEGYDIIVGYDESSLNIERVWDDNKEELTLSDEDTQTLKKEVLAYHTGIQAEQPV